MADGEREIKVEERDVAVSKYLQVENFKSVQRVAQSEKETCSGEETEHSHHLGRRHRLVQHQCLQPGDHGISHTQHRSGFSGSCSALR
jgi:hypothetical protein